jgi:hypothetical protein
VIFQNTEYNDCFSFAEEKFFKMTDYLKSREASALYLSEAEEYLQKDGRELLRHLLIAYLAERGVGDTGPGVTGADGIKRARKRLRAKKIRMLFGEIEIDRIVYSARGAPGLFPSDGMSDPPSPAVSYGLQKHPVPEIIKNSFDESAESAERWTGVGITGEQTKKLITESAEDFKNFYDFKSLREKKEAEPLPLLILASDGRGVVMRTEDLREETGKKAEDRKADNKRNSHFITNKKKSDAKRMATVASVYEIARFVRKPEDIIQKFFFTSDSEKKKIRRPRPKAKRVWASPVQISNTRNPMLPKQ